MSDELQVALRAFLFYATAGGERAERAITTQFVPEGHTA